jgi:hypothetical protein
MALSSMTDEKVVQTYTLGGRIFRMPKSRLPELIEKALKSGLSFRDIRRRAGNQIPLSTLNSLHKGRSDNPNLTTATICALAKGLGESPSVVFEAVIGRSTIAVKDDSLRQLVEDFAALPARDREELRLTLDMLKAEVLRRLHRDT